MDQIIEDGFMRLTETINELDRSIDELDTAIRSDLAGLLSRMVALTTPLIGSLGQQFLQKTKKDGKEELYDTIHYDEKMIIIGRAEEPVTIRPDNMTRKVDKQFCVLTEKGAIAELMYSDDGFIIDSYLNPLTAEDAIDFYGPGVIYMLYRALHDYANLEEELIRSLEMTIAFIQGEKKE